MSDGHIESLVGWPLDSLMRGEKLESENPTNLCRGIGESRASGRTFRSLETAPTGCGGFCWASLGLTDEVSFGHLIAAWRPLLRGCGGFRRRRLQAQTDQI